MEFEQETFRECKVLESALGFWFLQDARSADYAWSGMRWVPSIDGIPAGGFQICNFATAELAREYAAANNLKVINPHPVEGAPYGLMVHVVGPRDSDSTNGGQTVLYSRFVLTGGPDVHEAVEGPFQPNARAPRLELRWDNGTYKAVVVSDPKLQDGKYAGPMFGGNFIYASDSRFPCQYPIPVHDRFELAETAQLLSE
jgi:hypothetical protein